MAKEYRLRVIEVPTATGRERRVYDAQRRAAIKAHQEPPTYLAPRAVDVVLPAEAKGDLRKIPFADLNASIQEARIRATRSVAEKRVAAGLPASPRKDGRITEPSRELIQRVEVTLDGEGKPKKPKVSDAREAIGTLRTKAERNVRQERAEAARKHEAALKVQKAEARKTVKAVVKDNTKAARKTEEDWHKELVRAGQEKRFFIDGLGVAARWADGTIYSLRLHPRQHLVEKHIDVNASERDITGRFSQMLQQSRKYELDPQDIYESKIEKALESFDTIRTPKGKKSFGRKLLAWGAGEAFNRIPGLQGIHSLVQYVAKLNSPDSNRSKWGEFKHDLLLNGPVESIAALPVVGPTLVGFFFGSAALTGGTSVLVEGVGAALWTGGSFLYGQIYTPGKMEPAFDRVDKQVRYGALGSEERLLDIQTGNNEVLAAVQRTHAAGLVKAFTQEIKHSKPATDKNDGTSGKTSRLEKGINTVGGFLESPKQQAAAGERLRKRFTGQGRRTEAAQAQLPTAPQAPKEPTLAEKAAVAQKTAASHLKWVEAILQYAPQMIASTTGADKLLWRQSLAYAEEQMRVYQKAAQVAQRRA